jgi:hypothetical protein
MCTTPATSRVASYLVLLAGQAPLGHNCLAHHPAAAAAAVMAAARWVGMQETSSKVGGHGQQQGGWACRRQAVRWVGMGSSKVGGHAGDQQAIDAVAAACL